MQFCTEFLLLVCGARSLVGTLGYLAYKNFPLYFQDTSLVEDLMCLLEFDHACHEVPPLPWAQHTPFR